MPSVLSAAAVGGSSDRSCSELDSGGVDSGAGVDRGVCCGRNAAFSSVGTTDSAAFWASKISGVGAALGSGAGVVEVGEGADSEFGVILRRFDAVSPSTVSSSLSRLSWRGLSVWWKGAVDVATECAGAAPASPVAVANGGTIAAGEDDKGEEVDDDDGGGGIGFTAIVVSFLAVAASHVHFSRRTVAQIHVSFSCSCVVSDYAPAPTCPQVSSPSVCVPSVQSEPT